MSKAHNAIILSLGDKTVREVQKEKTADQLWVKLESLYLKKSLHNRLFLKQKLYSFKMVENKSIEEQLDEYNKIIDDLDNIEVTLVDEDKALLLLYAMPMSYEHFKDAMLHGREKSITLEEVQSLMKTKELPNKMEHSEEKNSESLFVRGRSGKKNGHQ